MTRELRRQRRRAAIEARKLEAKRRLAGAAAGPLPVADPGAAGHRVRPRTRRAGAPSWGLSALLAIDTLVTIEGRSIEQRVALARRLRVERRRG